MTTPVYGIDEWEQNQSQPHVTSNTAWRILEAMSSRVLASKSLTAPPSSVGDGDVFWIDGTGSDEWTGHDNEFAILIDADWHYVTPKTGWIFWIEDEGEHFWIETGSSPTWHSLIGS